MVRFCGRPQMLRGKQHDPPAEGRSEIEIVGYGKDGQALLVFATKDLEDIDLMSNIQMCVRLIEQQDPGSLAEGPRDQDTLSLPAREGRYWLHRQMVDIDKVHDSMGKLDVVRPFKSEPADKGGASHQHDFKNGEREHPESILRDVRDGPGDLAPSKMVPSSGRRIRFSSFSRVDFPEPFGPRRLRKSPEGTSNETSRNTGRSG